MNYYNSPENIQYQIIYQKNQLTNQTQPKKPLFKSLHKAIIIGLFSVIFITYRIIYHQSYFKNSIIDNSHEWTFKFNRWISQHASKIVIGIAQVIMECNTLCITFYWMIYVKNFRFPATVGVFQYTRNLIMQTTRLPFLSYVIWFQPGFNPLTFSYAHTADYFYSGHTGCLMIFILETNRLKLPKFIQIYLIFSLIYMVIMLLVNRVHYTIDIFGGALFSLYIHRLIDNNLVFFDQIFNAPYKAFDIVKQKIKKKLSQKQDQGTSLYDIQHT